MRLQNARNLGSGSLICASIAADGESAYVLASGSTYKIPLNGGERGIVQSGRTIVLPSGRVSRKGGKLHYESE